MVDIHAAAGLGDLTAVRRQHRSGVMIAVDIKQRNIQDCDEKLEIVKRQVAAGEDQIDIGKTFFGFNAVQFTLDSIANRQNSHNFFTRRLLSEEFKYGNRSAPPILLT